MNRDESLLNYIKNEILVIKRSTINLDQNSFLANDEKQRAVCMTLINIGEAVKQLSAQVKLKYKYVDWKGASSFLKLVWSEGFGYSNNTVVPADDRDIYLSVRVRQSMSDELISKIHSMGFVCKALSLA